MFSLLPLLQSQPLPRTPSCLCSTSAPAAFPRRFFGASCPASEATPVPVPRPAPYAWSRFPALRSCSPAPGSPSLGCFLRPRPGGTLPALATLRPPEPEVPFFFSSRHQAVPLAADPSPWLSVLRHASKRRCCLPELGNGVAATESSRHASLVRQHIAAVTTELSGWPPETIASPQQKRC